MGYNIPIMDELKKRLKKALEKLAQLKDKLEIDQKKQAIAELERQSQEEGFWNKDEQAKKIMQRLAGLQQDVKSLTQVEQQLDDAKAAIELKMATELEEKLKEIKVSLDDLEEKTYLSGPYDQNDAYLSVHAGQGGTEAMDWSAMLLRMYQRYADRQDFRWELVDEQPGEEAGIKSATLLIKGRQAYGYLRGEKGTHRLVRQSPFNADNLRQTSFASVQVMPMIEKDVELDIKPEEIEFEAFRSSAKGGQNVNKVSTAVRLKHLPTGMVVTCQTQRSQPQNRKIALDLLRAKLWERGEEKRQEKLKEIKGKHTPASWGTQIRSYVLHPYKLVKDLRTEIESRDPEAVLDGKLDDFIAAEVRQL